MFMHPQIAFVGAEMIAPAIAPALAPVPRPIAAPQGGIAAGALVETGSGWLPVESLQPGMAVQTWDGGLATVKAIATRWLLPVGAEAAMIHLPGGVLGLCSDLWLAPDQVILLESAAAAEVLGHPVALVRAGALAGSLGITRQRQSAPRQIITPIFAQAEVVFANTGARILCPGAEGPAIAVPAVGGQAMGQGGYLDLLDDDRAQALAGLIEAGALNTRDLCPAAA